MLLDMFCRGFALCQCTHFQLFVPRRGKCVAFIPLKIHSTVGPHYLWGDSFSDANPNPHRYWLLWGGPVWKKQKRLSEGSGRLSEVWGGCAWLFLYSKIPPACDRTTLQVIFWRSCEALQCGSAPESNPQMLNPWIKPTVPSQTSLAIK